MQRELPEGWVSVKIEEIATIEKNVASPDDLKGSVQNFIGLENIEKDSGRLVNFSETSGDELRSTKFKFTTEHILYGKLRPYLNKVFLPDFEGICSTDILTIKPNSKKVVKKYLELVLKGSDFVDYATTRSIGANLPRVSPSTVLNYSFALPPLPVQRQIVAILEQAEAVKRQRQEADALTGELLQSVFYEMFGDLLANDKKWEWTTIDNILKERGLSYGILKPGDYDEAGIPMLRVMDIGHHGLNSTEIFKVTNQLADQYERTKLHSGDIVLAVMATVGRCMIVPDFLEGANVNRALAVLKLNKKIDAQFLLFLMKSDYFQNVFLKNKIGSSQLRINLTDLRQFKIPLPPLALQQQFTRVVERVERIREQQVASGKEIEGLCEGLMQRAFAGELVA